MTDVAIIGAGITGLACAYRIASLGARVVVLERHAGAPDAASRAAAGMLSAQLERHELDSMASLCKDSRDRHLTLIPEIERETGIDVDHRAIGALRVAFDDDDEAELDTLFVEQRRRGWAAERVDATAARRLEPFLGEVRGALWLPDERVVDPPRLVEALTDACHRRGVVFVEGTEVRGMHALTADLRKLEFTNGEFLEAREVVVAGGAWSAALSGTGIEGLVRPIRGQMLELRHTKVPRALLEGPGGYLSPRSDGRVLVGSTLEDVGFERAVTAGAASRLMSAGLRMAPELAQALLSNHWCGFRAATSDKLPLLGRTSTGVIAATGQYRNGILLAAATADAVAALVAGTPLPFDLSPFAPERFSTKA